MSNKHIDTTGLVRTRFYEQLPPTPNDRPTTLASHDDIEAMNDRYGPYYWQEQHDPRIARRARQDGV